MAEIKTLSSRLLFAGETFTKTGVGQTIDGRTVAAGDEVFFPNLFPREECGLYVAAAGDWGRHPDFATSAQMKAGTAFFIREGSVYGFTKWYFEGPDNRVVDADSLYFRQRARSSPETNGPGTERSGVEIGLPERPDGQGTHTLGLFTQTITDRGVTDDFELGSAGEMFVYGMTVEPSSAVFLDAYPGAAYVPYRGSVAEQGTFEDIPYTLEDEPGGLVAGKLYHVYVSHMGQPTSPFYYLSPVAPVPDNFNGPPYVKGPSATPDRSRRYLQSVLASSTTGFHKQRAEGFGGLPFVRHITNANAAPFLVLSGGAATTETSVSCAGVVPPWARTAKIRVNAVGSAVSLGHSEDGITLAPTEFLQRVNTGAATEIDMPLDSNRALTYRNDSTGGATTINVLGYYGGR